MSTRWQHKLINIYEHAKMLAWLQTICLQKVTNCAQSWPAGDRTTTSRGLGFVQRSKKQITCINPSDENTTNEVVFVAFLLVERNKAKL